MPCELHEQIGISFDIANLHPHAICDPQFCVDKGEEICMSLDYRKYLENQFKVDQILKSNAEDYQRNDLFWYLSKDVETREFLASNRGHRLRYKEHDSKACKFIENVFDFHNKVYLKGNLLENDQPLSYSFSDEKDKSKALIPYNLLWKEDNLWGETVKNKLHGYENDFTELCETARKKSVGEIYRLYDLSSKYTNNSSINFSHFLALLYALGHKNKQKPSSISEFVSYYEFFKAYCGDCLDLHIEIAKKESLVNFNKKGLLGSYLFLSSDEGIKKANQTWQVYYEAIKNLFAGPMTFETGLSDDEFISALRNHLRRTPSPFSIPFSSLHSAAYHSYKHKDICTIPPEELPVCAYIEMTREIILNGTLSENAPPRPDQFGKGRIYTFEKMMEMNNKPSKMVRVFLLKGTDRNTFVLSTF